jgi:hypothetical protein
MTDDRLLGHNESHSPRFRNDRGIRDSNRGEAVQMHRRIAAARSPACLYRHGRMGRDPLPLLRAADPLRSTIGTVTRSGMWRAKGWPMSAWLLLGPLLNEMTGGEVMKHQ